MLTAEEIIAELDGSALLARSRPPFAFSAEDESPEEFAAFIAEDAKVWTRVVKDAKKLQEISYDEMLELAAQGAKVLHGPAEQPLCAVLLEHDAKADTLTAYATLGGELFDDFFRDGGEDLEVEGSVERFARGGGGHGESPCGGFSGMRDDTQPPAARQLWRSTVG